MAIAESLDNIQALEQTAVKPSRPRRRAMSPDSVSVDNNVNQELRWRADMLLEYFDSVLKVVPLYGQAIPQYPRRPTSNRQLKPSDFGIKDGSSSEGGAGTAKGLRGDEQMKDRAINMKSGKVK